MNVLTKPVPNAEAGVDIEACLRTAAAQTLLRSEIELIHGFIRQLPPGAAKAELDYWLEDPAARAQYDGYLRAALAAEFIRLGAGRVVCFAAQPGDSVPVPPAWGAPVVRWLERVAKHCADGTLSDAALLLALTRLTDELPGLLYDMDCDALADVLEAGMGQAAIRGAEIGLQKLTTKSTNNAKAGVQTFAAGDVEAPAVSLGPLAEAVKKLDQRTPVAAKLSSAEWARVPLALRERAQFSAGVASVRFLAEVQDQMRKRLAWEKESVANGEAFVDRGSFISHMREIAEQEGLDTTSDGRAGQRGTVRDIRSARRLGLIYDMQNNMATEFSRWKMDHDADVLDEFPAQRLLPSTADKPRPDEFWRGRWAEAGSAVGWLGASPGDMVALKTSPIWTALSAFGVPWPPFDYGSQRMLEDVDRAEAEAIGLLQPDRPVPQFGEQGGSGPQEFNDELAMSVRNNVPEMQTWLKDEFGDQVDIDPKSGVATWQGNKIADLYDKALANPQFKGKVNLGQATPAAIAKAAPLMDIRQHKMMLTADDVRKAMKTHGETEQWPGQRPLTRLDFEVLPHVWRAPDAVTRWTKTQMQEREKTKYTLEFRKRMLGQQWVVAWQRTPGNVLFPNTMWVEE